jgi:hypothetical protein
MRSKKAIIATLAYIVQISTRVQRTLHKLPPCIGTHTFTVSFTWEECNAINAIEAIHTISIFRSARYPLRMGGHRQCGFKACPMLRYLTSKPEIEPHTLSLSGPTSYTLSHAAPIRSNRPLEILILDV